MRKTWRAWSTGTPSSSVPSRTPYSKTGGIAVLKGNLAPDGCVVKQSAVAPEMMVHEGPARVFDSEEDAIQAIYAGKIVAGDVVVIRCEGPKGGPGMREMLNPTSAIAGMGLDKDVALITDGRFSGPRAPPSPSPPRGGLPRPQRAGGGGGSTSRKIPPPPYLWKGREGTRGRGEGKGSAPSSRSRLVTWPGMPSWSPLRIREPFWSNPFSPAVLSKQRGFSVLWDDLS